MIYKNNDFFWRRVICFQFYFDNRVKIILVYRWKLKPWEQMRSLMKNSIAEKKMARNGNLGGEMVTF